MFEKKLCEVNNFEDGLVVGSGFLANISLIEGLVRKKDILFIDEEYHASGMLASKLVDKVIVFKHNDYGDLEDKLKANPAQRQIVAIEGVYSMGGDVAPKNFAQVVNRYNALLIVDEAHSSGVIGENLLGWFDYHNLQIRPNYIKMGTLGKAYGSYGAYILASSHIISFLENRAKAIIYTTAPSLMDMAQGFINLEYIQNKKDKIKKKITE
jgi:8-amino-7-oxononanoate synthase